MCGILGGFGVEGMDHALVKRALDSISHRGPDEAGVTYQNRNFIGIRRLSIIDTAGGHQPIGNEDGSIWVVLNGEIYNYLEIREDLKSRGHIFTTGSDTEVLVHLYEELGEGLVERLRGMFAFCILDRRKNRALIGRDRFGKKPLYYTRLGGGGSLFASELKALRILMQAVGLPCEIFSQGIYDYLSLAIVPQPETVYKGVYSLPAASVMWLDLPELKPRSYWKLEADRDDPMPDDELYENVRKKIRESVRIRLRSDVPLGVLLSGGLDSSIVALEAAGELGGQLETFTIGVGDGRLDESGVAARTAAALGVRNTPLRMEVAPLESVQFLANHFDQPFADPSAIPSYAVCKLAREHVTVVLNGDGGDELFGGYQRYLAAHRARIFARVPLNILKRGASLFGPFTFRRRSKLGFLQRFVRGLAASPADKYLIWTTDMLRERDKQLLWLGGSCRATEAFLSTQIDGGRSLLEQTMDADIKVNLLSALLVKVDMTSMAVSVEARSPLLDHEVAELAARIGEKQLFKGGLTKAVLRNAYRNRLPAEVIDGPKLGFEIPLEKWLKSDMKDLLHDSLAVPNARILDYVDRSFVKALLGDDTMGDRNRPFLLYSLLILELWLKPQTQGTAGSRNFAADNTVAHR